MSSRPNQTDLVHVTHTHRHTRTRTTSNGNASIRFYFRPPSTRCRTAIKQVPVHFFLYHSQIPLVYRYRCLRWVKNRTQWHTRWRWHSPPPFGWFQKLICSWKRSFFFRSIRRVRFSTSLNSNTIGVSSLLFVTKKSIESLSVFSFFVFSVSIRYWMTHAIRKIRFCTSDFGCLFVFLEQKFHWIFSREFQWW